MKDSWRIPPTRALTMCHIHAIWVMAHHPHDSWYLKDSRLMIANTNLVPLLEGLCTSNPCRVDNRSLLQKSPVLLREGLCTSNPCRFECSIIWGFCPTKHSTYVRSDNLHRKSSLYLPLGSVNLVLKAMGTPDEISSPPGWNRVSPGCPRNFNTKLTEPTRQIKTTFPMNMSHTWHVSHGTWLTWLMSQNWDICPMAHHDTINVPTYVIHSAKLIMRHTNHDFLNTHDEMHARKGRMTHSTYVRSDNVSHT